MIEIREYHDGDIDIVRANPLEDAVKKYPHQIPQSPSFTGLVDGKIIGVGGITPLWDGVAEGWIMPSKDILNFRNSAYRCIKEMTSIVMKKSKLKRLQITVRTDYPKAIEMAEALGFIREGTMKFYCPDGADAYLYAKVIK